MPSALRPRTRSQRMRKTDKPSVNDENTAASSRTRKKDDNQTTKSTRARKDQKLTDLTNKDNVAAVTTRKSRSRVRTTSNREKHQSKTLEDVDRKITRTRVSSKTSLNNVEIRNCYVNLHDISTSHSYFDKDMVSKRKKHLMEPQDDSLITRMIKKRRATKESKSTSKSIEDLTELKSTSKVAPSTSKIEESTELKTKPTRLRKPNPFYAEYFKEQSQKRNIVTTQDPMNSQKPSNKDPGSSQILSKTSTRSLSVQLLEKTPTKVTLRSKSRTNLEPHDIKNLKKNAIDPVVLISTVKSKGRKHENPQEKSEKVSRTS